MCCLLPSAGVNVQLHPELPLWAEFTVVTRACGCDVTVLTGYAAIGLHGGCRNGVFSGRHRVMILLTADYVLCYTR